MPADAKCRSCDAPVRWVRTLKGERMPVDAEPTEDGNLVVVDGVASYVGAGAVGTRSRYTSHFATCLNASGWLHRRRER